MVLFSRWLAAILVLVVLRNACAEEVDWPQWLGPHRNGLSSERGLLQEWPAEGPRQVWLFDNCGSGYSGPAVVDGTLYILGAREGRTQLLALDVESGEELWSADISAEYSNNWGDGPRSTPTVDDGYVYALSADGTLICAGADDGREKWRVTMATLGGEVPNWGYSESVLIDGGKLLCTPGGPEGAIAALDKRSGKVVWQSKDIPDFAHYSSIVRGEFHGRAQYVQLLEKRLVGVSADDGSLLWEVGWPGSVAVIPTPIVAGERVFATSGYGAGCMLVEIDQNHTPKEIYRNKNIKNHHGGVIRINDHVYGYSDDIGWTCLEFETGKRVWRERDALGKGAIGYADNRLYCVDEDDGHVVLVSPSPDGWQEHGRFTLSPQSRMRKPRGGIWVHPVVVDGKLLLRDQEYLYCYDVKK